MMIKTCLIIFLCTLAFTSSNATNYYINTEAGKDENSGKAADKSWKTIKPLNNIRLQPGDSVLLAAGQRFSGMIIVEGVTGTKSKPVVISSYSYKGNVLKPVVDAGKELNALLIRNASFIQVSNIEFTATIPYANKDSIAAMRCGILVEVTKEERFTGIQLTNVLVHDVYFHAPGFTRSAAETKSANGTQNYGWGIRFINKSSTGKLTDLKILNAEIFNVCHTGLKITGPAGSIEQVEIANCKVYKTGGPGMQFSGLVNARIHHNNIHHSGSTHDSRNWGRGSGLWTWSCSNILIENNRFEYANGPGDSAGVHIDFNCSNVIVQYNLSANNAGGFCEILGNNFNCAYRYNISINDGYREKGKNGAFQEGKIFWLSGYQGDKQKSYGPFNSYFYNNTVYVGKGITPKIAVSSSAAGVLIMNNIFYFENPAQIVPGDQKKQEVDIDGVPDIIFKNNLFLRKDNWPTGYFMQDEQPLITDPGFLKLGGGEPGDYRPANKKMIQDKGMWIPMLPKDSIGINIGLKVKHDFFGKPLKGLPDMGAIELQ